MSFLSLPPSADLIVTFLAVVTQTKLISEKDRTINLVTRWPQTVDFGASDQCFDTGVTVIHVTFNGNLSKDLPFHHVISVSKKLNKSSN